MILPAEMVIGPTNMLILAANNWQLDPKRVQYPPVCLVKPWLGDSLGYWVIWVPHLMLFLSLPTIWVDLETTVTHWFIIDFLWVLLWIPVYPHCIRLINQLFHHLSIIYPGAHSLLRSDSELQLEFPSHMFHHLPRIKLVGGLEHFFFFHILGRITATDHFSEG